MMETIGCNQISTLIHFGKYYRVLLIQIETLGRGCFKALLHNMDYIQQRSNMYTHELSKNGLFPFMQFSNEDPYPIVLLFGLFQN